MCGGLCQIWNRVLVSGPKYLVIDSVEDGKFVGNRCSFLLSNELLIETGM